MKHEIECAWAMKHPLEREYHNREWGRAVFDDRTLFEFITLEGAQAGLSWITILKRRDAYRSAFEHYELSKLAMRDDAHADHIIQNYDVIRHRGKICSVFNNARASLSLIEEYSSLSDALWQFVDHSTIINHWSSPSQIPTATEQSRAMSRFLKLNGFSFVGETICYAFMQAVGMVDDHLEGCIYKRTR